MKKEKYMEKFESSMKRYAIRLTNQELYVMFRVIEKMEEKDQNLFARVLKKLVEAHK